MRAEARKRGWAVAAAVVLSVAAAGCGPGSGSGAQSGAAPVISAIGPDHGAVGQAVTIDGANFETDRALDSVFFGSAQAAVLSATTAEVVCQVPAGAATGSVPVTVSTRSGTSNAVSFTVDPQGAGAPSIRSLSPASGAIGTAVAILGSNFDPTAAGDTVTFNGTRATLVAASATRIDTSVPAGATSGQVVVRTAAGTSNGVTFTVTSTQPSSLGNVGSHATDYLGAVPYSSLLVEVDWIQGEDPDQNALNLLEQRLNERCRKPGGITIKLDSVIPAQGITTWRLSDIQALERRYRGSYSAGNTAVLYFLYLNGGYEDDTSTSQTLGISYTGSSICIFKDSVRVTRGNPANRSAVEDSVLVHEAGHNLGLVNIGVPMQSPHEDSAHSGHCTNTSCVNYWAVDTSLSPRLLSTIPNQWGQECLADLHAAGGK
jgi:hypothetical protein